MSSARYGIDLMTNEFGLISEILKRAAEESDYMLTDSMGNMYDKTDMLEVNGYIKSELNYLNTIRTKFLIKEGK